MKNYLLLYLKGMAMGAVDVVPGFSGGTMALITGIYDRLLAAFSSLAGALMLLLRGRIKEAWNHCDANFLLAVLLGILTSIFTLARLITYLMLEHPVPLWSFFFGLVLVSVYLVGREVVRWNLWRIAGMLLGFALAFWITHAAPVQLEAQPWILFCAGVIAISAMILPGISGSFMLILMGLYPVVLGAVKHLEFTTLAIFAAGCLVGLLGFSRLLSWLLQHFRDITLAFLTGVILGSLGKVWPWKETITWHTNSKGESFPLEQINLMPSRFAELSGQDPQLLLAIGLAVLGILLVLGVEWIAYKRATSSAAEAS